MIDIRKLKELVKLMVNNDLAEIDLRDPDEQVTLRRHGEHVVPTVTAVPAAAATAAVAPPPSEAPSQAAAAQEAGEEIALVKVGDVVDTDTTVCIIEAMKIFNEIKAQCTGTVTKVLVKNGEAVEFGQPLFIVSPQ